MADLGLLLVPHVVGTFWRKQNHLAHTGMATPDLPLAVPTTLPRIRIYSVLLRNDGRPRSLSGVEFSPATK